MYLQCSKTCKRKAEAWPNLAVKKVTEVERVIWGGQVTEGEGWRRVDNRKPRDVKREEKSRRKVMDRKVK